MEIVIIVILFAIGAFILGHIFGFNKGHEAGEQFGRLIQHGIEQNIKKKR
jgi:hypothetical protein